MARRVNINKWIAASRTWTTMYKKSATTPPVPDPTPDPVPGDPRADFVVGTTVPTRTNTGIYSSASSLTVDNRTAITGTTTETIRDKRFPNKVTITASNKTFINCLFEGRTGSGECVLASEDTNRNLKFTDCTFAQPESMFPKGYLGTSGGKMGWRGHNSILLRCQFVTVVDGFRVRRGPGGDANTQLLGCFVDDLLFLSPDTGQPNRQSHNDVFQDDQTVDQSNVLIKGCWLASHLNPRCGQAALPVDPPGWRTTADGTRLGGNLEYPSLNGNANVQFAKTGIKLNYEFDSNWMFGGSVIFNAGAGSGDGGKLSTLRITNNRIGRDMRLGEQYVLLIGSTATIEAFTGNVYYDNGAPANFRKNG